MERPREVLELLPHGLYLVGVAAGGERFLYTASWLTQASFEPPLVVTAVRRSHRGHRMIQAAGAFAVSLLGADQLDLARRGFEHRGDRLAGLEWKPCPRTGAPVVLHTLGYLGCRLDQWVAGGDHDLAVAEIVAAERFRDGRLLTIHDTPWCYW